MSPSSRPLLFRSGTSIQFSALSIFLPDPWLRLFLGENVQFGKIEQLLEAEDNVITSRLGRRQMSLFSSSSARTPGRTDRAELLRMQNDTLGLLEYFLSTRHRSLLGMSPVSDIENEDDLSLIREVESYISEYYCSDTFTVDFYSEKDVHQLPPAEFPVQIDPWNDYFGVYPEQADRKIKGNDRGQCQVDQSDRV